MRRGTRLILHCEYDELPQPESSRCRCTESWSTSSYFHPVESYSSQQQLQTLKHWDEWEQVLRRFRAHRKRTLFPLRLRPICKFLFKKQFNYDGLQPINPRLGEDRRPPVYKTRRCGKIMIVAGQVIFYLYLQYCSCFRTRMVEDSPLTLFIMNL